MPEGAFGWVTWAFLWGLDPCFGGLVVFGRLLGLLGSLATWAFPEVLRPRGMSQEELADRSGLHQTYISGIERGIRIPTVMVVDRLADALQAEPEELVTRKHSP